MKAHLNYDGFPIFQLYKKEPIPGDLSEKRYIAPEYGTRHKKTLEDLRICQLTERKVIA